ncbi:YwmB family TATA-box binding protein [Bacillus haynesii]|uniref:YwmB family TATA-box binding protein n=1 Tax=Bacillus haynesii TaxID=1925021 RepID=UPI00228213A8|nr:YwmB family TATA-box binding protein [Bacillus haynesii]MCY8092760.1 YwmB family TATA-box binding protein [Bacillus haynesii]MCY8292402.1 YwmB family TATA-box binding protein [Bacillus haynesii]MCY8408179.1 YwmB family TATA-box binding protein [Bacillus haynesii]MCY8431842.1 YwmB family TATA-box binding protein [Bacillus haynesii]MCY8626583.1 YwmB family TATA-box binding protein [Bacillus haynesii]
MKTKQTVNALIFIVVLFLIVHVFQSLEAAGNTPLEQMAEGLSRHDVELEEWTLHTKKQLTLSEKDFFAKLKHFKKQHRQYQWTLTREDDDTVKATGVFQDKKNHINSKIYLVSTHKNQRLVSYLLYEQKGAGPRENWNATYKQFERDAFDIMREKTAIFTCLKGHLNGMMNVVLQKKANELVHEFDAKSVEDLIEPNFVSISAYTNEWKESIKTEKHLMNLQVSLRNAGMGEKLTVTVGTPIVTTEY